MCVNVFLSVHSWLHIQHLAPSGLPQPAFCSSPLPCPGLAMLDLSALELLFN